MRVLGNMEQRFGACALGLQHLVEEGQQFVATESLHGFTGVVVSMKKRRANRKFNAYPAGKGKPCGKIALLMCKFTHRIWPICDWGTGACRSHSSPVKGAKPMKHTLIYGAGILALGFAAAAFAQTTDKPRSTIAQSLTPPALPQQRVTDALIEFPLPKGEEKYGSINGKVMHRYVEELAQISRQYRDAGHPKFWGRIIGAESDTATNEWLAGKFRAAGLSDVRIQPLDLPPQWMPKSSDVALTAAGALSIWIPLSPITTPIRFRWAAWISMRSMPGWARKRILPART